MRAEFETEQAGGMAEWKQAVAAAVDKAGIPGVSRGNVIITRRRHGLQTCQCSGRACGTPWHTLTLVVYCARQTRQCLPTRLRRCWLMPKPTMFTRA